MQKNLSVHGICNQLAEIIQSLPVDRDVHVPSGLLRYEQTRVKEHLEVMRDRGLRKPCDFFRLAAGDALSFGNFA